METIKRSRIVILFFLVLANSCSNEKKEHDQNFVKVFVNRVDSFEKNSGDSIVNIVDMTSFEWEELYVFKPYTQVAEIESKLGFKWKEAESTLVHQSDEFNLLVFVKSKKVVDFAKVPRNHGDFYKLTTNGPFTRDKSFFIVRKELFGSQPWIFLYPR